MIAPNNIGERSTEIYELIASDQVREALKRIMDFVRDFSADNDCLKEAVIISQNYNSLNRYERIQALKFEDLLQQRNRLIYSMLGLLDAVKLELVDKTEIN